MCQSIYTLVKAMQLILIFYFEIGALVASLLWGYVSDLLKGRRAIEAIGCMFMITFVVLFYTNATSVMMVNISLFALGALIFGPAIINWCIIDWFCS